MNENTDNPAPNKLTGTRNFNDFVNKFDWHRTTLGDRKFWSPVLEGMVHTCLHCPSAMSILWGEHLVKIYNEAYSGLIGLKHPDAFGAGAQQVWSDTWEEMEPMLKRVVKDGESLVVPNSLFMLNRKRAAQQEYVTSYSPIYNEKKRIEGILMLTGPSANTNAERDEAEKLEKLVEERTAWLRRRNEELKKSEERYHKMVDEVEDYAIIFLDKDGIIRNWNSGAQKIKLYQESEVIGRHFEIFYLPNDRASKLPQKIMNEAVTRGKAIHEGWRVRKDQTRFWGSITLTALHGEDGGIIGFTKVTRDLTERKIVEDQLKSFTVELQQRNEALRKSEERYHKMIGEVQDYAIILLNDKGEIQNWNAGAEKIKGYSASDIIGKNFRVFYPDEDRDRQLPEKLLDEARKNGRATHEGWRVRKDGTRFWGNIVITALHANDGSIIGFSKVTRDLTERKRAEDKMRDYLVELEAQNKELEQFAYVASHDLQEPLRKIRTFADVIQKNFQDKAMAGKYFEKIESSAQRMSELIKSVLNYSRLSRDKDQMVDTDMNAVLANVKGDFELLITDKNALIYSEPLPVITAIPSQISQLFSNLIGNALKFADKQPVIHISSKIVQRHQIPNLPAHQVARKYVDVTFTDNGIGFDQQYEKLIFSMFQRLHGKQDYSGTGIGLAICKKIMENHNGFITAKGELSKGASFSVYFPLG